MTNEQIDRVVKIFALEYFKEIFLKEYKKENNCKTTSYLELCKLSNGLTDYHKLSNTVKYIIYQILINLSHGGEEFSKMLIYDKKVLFVFAYTEVYKYPVTEYIRNKQLEISNDAKSLELYNQLKELYKKLISTRYDEYKQGINNKTIAYQILDYINSVDKENFTGLYLRLYDPYNDLSEQV